MRIYYSKQVLKGLNEYIKALVSYPILKESDAYHIMEFGGFVRLSSEIYLTQYVP
jgi:hypothetical protein